MSDYLPPERVTNDPRNADARIFVGNIDMTIHRNDLEKKFEKYGVLAVTVLRGYGFVQFGTHDDAREAIERENGTIIKGRELILKFTNQSKGHKEVGGTRAEGGGRGGRGGSPQRYGARSMAPAHGEEMRIKRPRRHSPWEEPQLTRGMYDAPAERGNSHMIEGPVDCELVLTDRRCKRYAEDVENRLRTSGMSVSIIMPHRTVGANQVLDQISCRGSMYAIVFPEDSQLSRTLSLHILNTNPPEEYHDIGMEDAIAMVTGGHQVNRSGGGERGGRPATTLSHDIVELLDMVRQDHRLTSEDYTHLIRFLEAKRDSSARYGGAPIQPPKPVPAPAAMGGGMRQQQQRTQQQMDLHQKIISFVQAYNGGGQVRDGIGAANVPRGIPAPGAGWPPRRY